MQSGSETPPSTTTPTPKKETSNSSSRNPYCLLAISLVSLISILAFSSSTTSTSIFHHRHHHHRKQNYHHLQIQADPNSPPPLPSIAYYISGSDGESDRIIRLLHSIYHPRNQYLLHLDPLASNSQRIQLALSIQSNPIFTIFSNVNVIGKPDFSNPFGSSSISSTLHAASLLLRLNSDWDYFISLCSNDYPLLRQDDLLHILSYLPKDLNFINHTSYIRLSESERRLKRIMVDQGLFLTETSEIFYGTQRREMPNAYKLFTGSSSSSILSRKFLEFCIMGTDNLPRTVLMYLSNTPNSQSNYFQTVGCNSEEFNKTIVNHNLHWQWSSSSSSKNNRNSSEFEKMIKNGAAFVTGLSKDDDFVLDKIDEKVLNRRQGRIMEGGWCLGDDENYDDPCIVMGNENIVRPSSGSKRLEKLIVGLLSNSTFRSNQCIFE